MNSLKQTLIFLFVPSFLFASTCDHKLIKPLILSELQQLRQSIYTASNRTDRKIIEADFKNKVKELSVILQVSEIEVYEILNTLPTSIAHYLSKHERVSKNENTKTIEQQIIELMETYHNYVVFRQHAIDFLGSFNKKNIPLEIYYRAYVATSTSLNIGTRKVKLLLILFADRITLLNETTKKNPTIDVAKIATLIADLDIPKLVNTSSFMTAVMDNDIALIKLLVLLDLDINAIISDGRSSKDSYLSRYLKNQYIQIETVKTLVQLGIDLGFRNQNENNYLHILTNNNGVESQSWLKTADLLISYNPNLLIEEDWNGQTPYKKMLRKDCVLSEIKPWMMDWFFSDRNLDYIFNNASKKMLMELEEILRSPAFRKTSQFKSFLKYKKKYKSRLDNL